MLIGAPGSTEAVRVTAEATMELLDVFKRHGHTEVDTAAWVEQRRPGGAQNLHPPDCGVPTETLREVNKVYLEGAFERFGLSNYPAWEVAQICQICKRNGWVMPTVYQGVYNALHRAVEAELIPCLRAYGISFYIYNPLAGGFLTDRFNPDCKHGAHGRMRYWNEPNFKALDLLRPVVAPQGITESDSEPALRWLAHYSVLKKEFGDAVIIGAASEKHLQDNLVAMDKGPLPADILAALDAGWEETRTYHSRIPCKA
ncbi:NADP-dependent oxidoreductase domain-containing protein [Mycena albidolilacea]|uniref:NADP-dependent oxidoreductase domain-containing protein n=1 Tax=Mycena albidolilacea TaxID=1033008 RepID=A0AAD7EY07_9AGAR|nr:NADP-dependent oxidoreductase domain-containing protein [Mycena albidolilacea]